MPTESDYLNLWMQQSQLFWSRLQIAITIHSGGLVGWYFLIKENGWLASMLLIIIISVSICLHRIMKQDVKIKDAIAHKCLFFDEYHKNIPINMKNTGSKMAFASIELLILIEMILTCVSPYIYGYRS